MACTHADHVNVYIVPDDSTLREFDRQAFTNVGVSLSRAASETVDQIDDQVSRAGFAYYWNAPGYRNPKAYGCI